VASGERQVTVAAKDMQRLRSSDMIDAMMKATLGRRPGTRSWWDRR